MTNYSLMGYTGPIFPILELQSYLWNGEAKLFKFRLLIDTEEYYCNHRLPLQAMCLGSRNVFKFLEISDNI